MKQKLSWIVVALLLLISAAVTALRACYLAPLPGLTAPELFVVKPGGTLGSISADLSSRGIVPNSGLLELGARLSGAAGALKAGEYRLEPGLSTSDLVALLVSGEVVQNRVTFIEGWTMSQALEAMAEMETIEHTLAGTSAKELAGLLGLEMENPEGMIHPDTYFFTRGTSDLQILHRARRRQQLILDELWQSRSGDLPYELPLDALIMASIIEKESGQSSEKGHIAGVFVRRLQLNMRLQSDPTVIYGLGADFADDLTRVHLNTMSPYNTYRINGLPPTPIALPGADSITASFNPLPSDYLYFVSTGEGGHKFSATLKEHNAAVNQYQRGRGDKASRNNSTKNGPDRQGSNDQ